MEHTKVPVDPFTLLDFTEEDPNGPDPARPSLAAKLFASRFGLAPDTAITVAGLAGLPQIDEL